MPANGRWDLIWRLKIKELCTLSAHYMCVGLYASQRKQFTEQHSTFVVCTGDALFSVMW